MIIGDLGAITGLLFILIAMLSGSLELWHIYFGMTLSSMFAAIQNPAYKAAVTDLVTKEFYDKASALVQLAGSANISYHRLLPGSLCAF
jgi:hypothetical protein